MRLEITRKTDLATQALLALGGASRSKSGELARRIGTTPGFLAQVMTPLVGRGWVHSEPGPTGGYFLSADLNEISVLQVIEAVEGPTESGRCVLERRPCDATGACALHQPWTRARSQLLAELAATKLSTLPEPATAHPNTEVAP
ncbi:MAG: Rrf2 family transcriptional regulator [Acidimicrobiia bacterium]|nr:Rrf2 family transcriptional regulator [Acidimicrobiia bacterium]